MKIVGLILLFGGSIICASIVLLALIGPLYINFTSTFTLFVGFVLLISLIMILVGFMIVFKKNDENVDYV